MTIDGTRYERRVEAGGQLKVILAKRFADAGPVASPTQRIGELAGFPVNLRAERDSAGRVAHIELDHSPVRLSVTPEELNNSDPAGLVQRLENRLRGLENARDEALAEMAKARSEAEAARARIGAPFEHETRLDKLRRRQAEIERALAPDPEGSASQETRLDAQRTGVGPSTSPAPLAGSHDDVTSGGSDIDGGIALDREQEPPDRAPHASGPALLARIVHRGRVLPEQGLEL